MLLVSPEESLVCVKEHGSMTKVHKRASAQTTTLLEQCRWTDETKVKLFGLNAHTMLGKNQILFQQKHTLHTSEHGTGRVMVRAFYASTGSEHLAVIQSSMNSSVCMQEYRRDKFEAICLTAKARSKLGHATDQ